jgi:hypothetical protein
MVTGTVAPLLPGLLLSAAHTTAVSTTTMSASAAISGAGIFRRRWESGDLTRGVPIAALSRSGRYSAARLE